MQICLINYIRVFPTPVGVFLANELSKKLDSCLPHARGGVSLSQPPVEFWDVSSPRPWGCFSSSRPHCRTSSVFPTPVGVFPNPACSPSVMLRLPHARGGVSLTLWYLLSIPVSSPRPWGCFHVISPFFYIRVVFPTPVGVFLCPADAAPRVTGLPHARGGVSYSI